MPITAQFDALGGPENVKLIDRSTQPPAPGEVQVRMRAAGLNRAELLYIAGHYLVQPLIPEALLGAEGAGEIVAIGEDVSDYSIVDRVCVLPMMKGRCAGRSCHSTLIS